jgi:serine/threonine-protein kinase
MRDRAFEDDYRIDELIAEGGCGAVYRATHLATGCSVAIKVLLHQDAIAKVRFEREAEMLARLRHPNTVMTYQVGTTSTGATYIAMELLRGETLHERLHREGPLAWRDAVAIAREVCAALAEAHDLGIVHRDLKPANIHLEALAGGGESVKVIDFGIAKLDTYDDELTYIGEVIGTPEYMAPEQRIGGQAAPTTDIYALGLVLYEMLAGERPSQIPVPPSSVRVYASLDVMTALDHIVMCCLAFDPDDRISSIAALAAALERVERDRPGAPNAWRSAPRTDIIATPEPEPEIAWRHSSTIPAAAAPPCPPRRFPRGSELTLKVLKKPR